jgi:dTDP-4-dehydrorhamnose 3,5-epimerase
MIQKYIGDLSNFGLKYVEIYSLFDDRGSFKKILSTNTELYLSMVDVKEVFITNSKKGTIRGMHIQGPIHPMKKIITVLSGKILDVVVDLRESSPSYNQYIAIEMSDDNHALFIPEGFAHGFQVLSDDAKVLYLANTEYCQICDTGFHSSSLESVWPMPNKILSERDSKLTSKLDFDVKKVILHQ